MENTEERTIMSTEQFLKAVKDEGPEAALALHVQCEYPGCENKTGVPYNGKADSYRKQTIRGQMERKPNFFLFALKDKDGNVLEAVPGKGKTSIILHAGHAYAMKKAVDKANEEEGDDVLPVMTSLYAAAWENQKELDNARVIRYFKALADGEDVPEPKPTFGKDKDDKEVEICGIPAGRMHNDDKLVSNYINSKGEVVAVCSRCAWAFKEANLGGKVKLCRDMETAEKIAESIKERLKKQEERREEGEDMIAHILRLKGVAPAPSPKKSEADKERKISSVEKDKKGRKQKERDDKPPSDSHRYGCEPTPVGSPKKDKAESKSNGQAEPLPLVSNTIEGFLQTSEGKKGVEVVKMICSNARKKKEEELKEMSKRAGKTPEQFVKGTEERRALREKLKSPDFPLSVPTPIRKATSKATG